MVKNFLKGIILNTEVNHIEYSINQLVNEL